MKKIDEGYDNLLKSNYELHSSTLQELKVLAKSWYDVDLSDFDSRSVRSNEENTLTEMKKSGLMCNYFFAYKEGDKYYLLDGFNRLFTDYGNIEFDCPVYIKIITDNLKDHELMHVLFRLNMWKLQERGFMRLDVSNFLDRGFRLFINEKFGISLYSYPDQGYKSRTKENSDFSVLREYFKNESEMTHDFSYGLAGTSLLFSNEKIVEDFREIVKCNDYMLPLPFNHYDTFLEGFIRFVSWRRVNGDIREYKFDTYLELLKGDNKFFGKLQKMSWTDSTRKNVYKWFRELKL